MGTTFLGAATEAGLIDKAQATAYEDFLSALQTWIGVKVPIHGLELHLNTTRFENGLPTADFACLLEGITHAPCQPWTRLAKELQTSLDCTSAWIEFDSSQWEPPKKEPNGLPLLYLSLSHTQSPKEFAQTRTDNLITTLQECLKENNWKGDRPPEKSELNLWLESLPQDSQIQQFGVAFRHGKIQPRVLLNLPERGAIMRILQEQQAPLALRRQDLEGQMLIAAVFPHSVEELMGLEVLADRCSIINLRKMRQPPRLSGSRLERLLTTLGAASDKELSTLSSIEKRSSQPISDGLRILLRGTNHAKIALSKGKVITVKAYIGEVSNYIKRTALCDGTP